MTDDQRLKVTELRAAIAATAQSKEGAPMAVRTAVLTLRDQMRRDGITARVLAEAVGVHERSEEHGQRTAASSMRRLATYGLPQAQRCRPR